MHLATDGRDILLNDPDGWEVDQPWLWFLGPANSGGTGGPFGNPPPGASDSAGLTNLPSVTRCTSLIVDTIAGLPWKVFRGTDELTTPAWIEDPQALRVDGRVLDPSSLDEVRLSPVEFWANWITAALWFGDGFIYVPMRDSNGAPAPPLWQLHPHDVTIDAGRYYVSDIELPPGSVIHLRGQVPYWDGRGTGVIDRHGLDLGLAASVRSYADGVFHSGVPAGYLRSSQPNLNEEQATKLKERWMAQHGSRRSIAVLNSTTEFHPVSISPVDAQLSTAREWSLRDVALAFGVPAYQLGVPGDSATYANVESRMIEFRMFTLLPWMRRAEACLDAQLARGTSLKIMSDGVLRADTKSRTDAYKTAIESGWLTIDEVRALEDRPPLNTDTQGVA